MTTCKVLDSGRIGGEAQLNTVVEELGKITKKAIVAEVEAITHWWLLESDAGEKMMYFGTEESFKAKFCK